MVKVERGTSGNWWRMECNGQVDYLESEPTDADKAYFERDVFNAKRRSDMLDNLPVPPSNRKSESDYR